MKTQNIILIAIAILVIALVAVGIYSFTNNGENPLNTTLDNNTTHFINIGTINANDTNNTNNTTVVGDNSHAKTKQETIQPYIRYTFLKPIHTFR